MELKKMKDENECQFLWRLGQAKDNGLIDYSWLEIADIMNKEFRDDVTEYRNESAYRKVYQSAKKLFEANVFNQNQNDSYIQELRETKHEIRKEKQRLFDERRAINQTLRVNARAEQDLDMLKSLIIENGKTCFPMVESDTYISDNDLIIALSDFHLGIDVDNNFGTYNAEIAEKRLKEYIQRILKIRNLHKSQNAYIVILGDILSGNIHFTTQLENRENVIEQVQKSAELISAFVYELSKYFENVYVNGVAGNHSRISYKDQCLRGERLDNLIPWYMKAKLSTVENVKFIDDNNYDPTIGKIEIRGQEYLMVHGDFDSFSESGVSKLVLMLGYKPKGIFYGHLHRCSYDEIAGVKLIRSGSFCGTSDDYTISKRLSGAASQMVCVATKDGIKACYPVELK